MADTTMRAVYALGMLQFVLTGGVMLSYPPLSSVLFTVSPSDGFNFTNPGTTAHVYVADLTIPSLLISLGVVGFVSVTLRMGSECSMESLGYTDENMASSGHWNALFWMIAAGVHLVFVSAVCSPVDFFACLVASYTMVRALFVVCQPLREDPSMMQVNSSLVGFTVGMCVAQHCVPARYQSRYATFFLLGILDYILVVGHTWDRNTSIQTVANCRLCWALSSTLCLAALHGGFHDKMLMG